MNCGVSAVSLRFVLEREIAAPLFISLPTVRLHLKNIYAKLHVNSRTEAVIKAIQEKLA